jgi:H+/gluconate symporter-like permease
VLGTDLGGVFILILGMSYLEWRRRRRAPRAKAMALQSGQRACAVFGERLAHPLLALLPLLLVGVANNC